MEKLIGKLLVEGNITADVAIQLLGGVLKEVHERELTEARRKMKEAMEEADRLRKQSKEIGDDSKKRINDDFTEKLKKIIEDAAKKREEEKKKQIYPDGWNPFKQPFNPPPPLWDPEKYKITMDEGPKTFGDICSCNPKNGGSGICNCIMGNQPLWPEGDKISPTVMPMWYQTSSDRIVDTDNAATLGENV